MRSPLYLLCLLAIAFASAPLLAPAQDASAPEEIYLDDPPKLPEARPVGKKTLVEQYKDETTRVKRSVLLMSDDTILNDGTYEEYYRDGQKFCEGRYSRGVHDGEWTFWHPNGQLNRAVVFENGQPHGQWKVFREDGTLLAERKYEHGKRAGKWVSYHEDGKTPREVVEYKDGKPHGVRHVYWPNGQERQQLEFVDGVRNGQLIEWDESGHKTAEATIVDGKVSGEIKRYTDRGETDFELEAHEDEAAADDVEAEVEKTEIKQPEEEL